MIKFKILQSAQALKFGAFAEEIRLMPTWRAYPLIAVPISEKLQV